MNRNWTWRNEEAAPADEIMLEIVSGQCDELMARWNALERQHGAMANARHDEETSVYDVEAAEEQAHEEADERGLEGREAADWVDERISQILVSFDEDRTRAIHKLILQQEVIEGLLNALGARLARPYEHWNEEERLMQWLEEDRFDRYDDGY